MTKAKRQLVHTWEKTDREDQDRYLRFLWRDGFSEGAIAHFFKTTKNTIVRRRHGLGLTTEGRGEVKSRVTYERFTDLLDIEEMDELVEHNDNVVCFSSVGPPPGSQAKNTSSTQASQRSTSKEKPKYQLASDWKKQCIHGLKEGKQCAYVKEPGSEYCKLHGK